MSNPFILKNERGLTFNNHHRVSSAFTDKYPQEVLKIQFQ